MTGRELDRETREHLRTLPADLAERVARHLVMVGNLLDGDPQRALAHAQAARRLASRVAAVREATGVAAYACGDYGTALAELRAARRMSGADDLLPLIADCERGLGRPERALALASGPQLARLPRATRIEMLIVAAGARRDLGNPQAAVLLLRVPELQATGHEPWLARLRYAYADALLAVDRSAEAARWFASAAEADADGATDAGDRLAELEGIRFEDAWDPAADPDDDLPGPGR